MLLAGCKKISYGVSLVTKNLISAEVLFANKKNIENKNRILLIAMFTG